MPIIKYTIFASVSLLALLTVADYLITPVPASAPSNSTSLEVLRKMANHGEVRGFAPLAATGPFLPMPAVPLIVAASEPIAVVMPVAAATPPSALNAQARVAATDLIDKPVQTEKKVAPRKPKPRAVYVENTPRGQTGGFFGAFNTW